MMPSPSTNKSENIDSNQSTLKHDNNENKPDVGANIILIGAPGSGK